MYFQARDGFTYPSSRIRSIGKVREVDAGAYKSKICTVYLDDEETTEIDLDQLRAIKSAPLTSFAALPGTFLLYPDDDGTEKPYWTTPVIGWSICADGEFSPITAEGINDGTDQHKLIITPDGTVTDPFSATYKNVDEWIKTYRSHHQK